MKQKLNDNDERLYFLSSIILGCEIWHLLVGLQEKFFDAVTVNETWALRSFFTEFFLFDYWATKLGKVENWIMVKVKLTWWLSNP